MDETIFETVTFDADEFVYRAENGETVKFSKFLHIQFEGELIDTPLSYTTLGGVKVPCVRINGDRYNLDHEGLLIASDCVIPLG